MLRWQRWWAPELGPGIRLSNGGSIMPNGPNGDAEAATEYPPKGQIVWVAARAEDTGGPGARYDGIRIKPSVQNSSGGRPCCTLNSAFSESIAQRPLIELSQTRPSTAAARQQRPSLLGEIIGCGATCSRSLRRARLAIVPNVATRYPEFTELRIARRGGHPQRAEQNEKSLSVPVAQSDRATVS